MPASTGTGTSAIRVTSGRGPKRCPPQPRVRKGFGNAVLPGDKPLRPHPSDELRRFFIDVRMHVLAEGPRGERRDDLVRVHVRARAGAGLEYLDRKLLEVLPFRDLERRGLDRPRDVIRQQAERVVRRRRRPLQQAERANERRRHRLPADAEIVDCALRLRAPERIRGDFELPHAVALDSMTAGHACSCFERKAATLRRTPVRRDVARCRLTEMNDGACMMRAPKRLV